MKRRIWWSRPMNGPSIPSSPNEEVSSWLPSRLAPCFVKRRQSSSPLPPFECIPPHSKKPFRASMKSSKPSLSLWPPLDLKDSTTLMLWPMVVLLLLVVLAPIKVGTRMISTSMSFMVVGAFIGHDAGTLAKAVRPPRVTQDFLDTAFFSEELLPQMQSISS